MLFYITVCLLHPVTLHDVAHNTTIYISALKPCVPCILHTFATYNQQMHNIFNTYLYLKKFYWNVTLVQQKNSLKMMH
jgi:hypothetical protein